MVMEGVPWMVDGADHTAEVGRLLAYAASNSGEGVIGVADCAVVASAIPDSNVNIQSGAASLLNRFPGGGQQSYLVRNVGNEVVALTPQGSSGVRYDLVAIVVEDPQYPGQPAPPSIPDGPYVRARVYPNVPAATRTLAEIDPDQTGYALALVKFNASDGTVTNSDITDLRALVNPRTKVFKRMYNEVEQAADGSGAYELTAVDKVWPPQASWSVEVPIWATKMQIEANVTDARVVDTTPGAAGSLSFGVIYVRLAAVDSAPGGWVTAFNAVSGEYDVTHTGMAVADELDVPDDIRGTVQTVSVRANKSVSIGHMIGSDWGTTVILSVTFYEEPGF